MLDYKLVPLSGDIGSQIVEGKRNAVAIARDIANSQGCEVHLTPMMGQYNATPQIIRPA